MSELITTSSAYIINGDSPMTSVANTVAMTTFAVHTLQPLIFYKDGLVGFSLYPAIYNTQYPRGIPRVDG